jgi:phenylacetate-CoA ligase
MFLKNSLKLIKPGNLKKELVYNYWHNQIKKSENWSFEQHKNYQWSQIKSLLTHSFENVPYYHKLFKSMGALPNDIKTWGDFEKIPPLTKDILKNNLEDLKAQNFSKKKLEYFTTGGSTAQPMGFYKTNKNTIIEEAFMYSQWERVGFKRGASIVVLRGAVPQNNLFFHQERFSNTWIFSSFKLNKNTINDYVTKLNEIKPQFSHVYPSSLNIFINLLLESNLSLNFSPKAVFCGSEPITSEQRVLFEKVLGTRVYSWLGSAEQTVLAGECEKSNLYHSYPQYSYLELLDEKNEIIREPNISGEITGTHLHNYATPFIRYKSGDLASIQGSDCNFCNRKYPIINNVKGRVQDILYSNDGATFPVGPAIFGIHENFWSDVSRLQIIQEKVGFITIKIDSNKPEVELKPKLNLLFKERFGNKIEFIIEFSKDLSLTKNGKHKFLIQHLKH